MPEREIEAAADAGVLPRAVTEAIEAYGHAMFGAGEWTEDDDAPYRVLSAAAGVARRRLVAAIAGALGARELDFLAETARWLAEERDRLRAAGALLRDVARECTVEFEDSRLDYVVVQCDRHLWDAVQRAAPAEGAR